VSDIRESGGDDFKYDLVVRKPKPGFEIKVEAPDLTINVGSGKEFSVMADRIDDFDGEIRVDVNGLPPGLRASTPLVIEAGQTTAYGTITADVNAPAPTAENAKLAKLTAFAIVNGKKVAKDGQPLGELKLAKKPKLLIRVLASNDAPRADSDQTDDGVVDVYIQPGETISAIVRLERNGFDGEVGFGTEHAGRNLPHGVYIDNIGLNGLTLLQGESERQFFITAARHVPKTTRLFHLRAGVEGNQTSLPVRLHVQNLKTTDHGQNVAANGADAGE
jgi:hypothetical protein